MVYRGWTGYSKHNEIEGKSCHRQFKVQKSLWTHSKNRFGAHGKNSIKPQVILGLGLIFA